MEKFTKQQLSYLKELYFLNRYDMIGRLELEHLFQQFRDENQFIEECCRRNPNDKLKAVKEVKLGLEHLGYGLKEAKQLVDAFWAKEEYNKQVIDKLIDE